MRLKTPILAAVALGLGACSPAGAPDSVSRMSKIEIEQIVKEYLLREPQILADVQVAYQHKMIEEQTSHAEGMWDKLVASSKDDPSIGPANAPITIVEFSDYECGVCKQALPWVIAQVDDRRGDIRLVVKEAAWKGAGSEPAARAAIAAHKQGKYREMHIALMKAPSAAYAAQHLETIAKSVGLDIPRWKSDMASDDTTKRIQRAGQEFDESGVGGTPSFLINGKFVGGFGTEQLESLIEATRQLIKSKT